MIGAILGDIIGSPYEFDCGDKTKVFPLFVRNSTYTDDTVMTLAVADAFLQVQPDAGDDEIRSLLTVCSISEITSPVPAMDAASTAG